MLWGGIGEEDQQNPVQAIFCIILGVQGILHSYQVGAFLGQYVSKSSGVSSKGSSDGNGQTTAEVVCIEGAFCENGQQHGSNSRHTTADGPKAACTVSQAHRVGMHQCRASDAGPHVVSVSAIPDASISPNITDGSPSLATTSAESHDAKHNELSPAAEDPEHVLPIAFMIGASVFLVLSSVGLLGAAAFGFSDGHVEWPSVLLAGALAPVGALLRWQLARLNQLPERMSANPGRHATLDVWLELNAVL